MNEPTKEERIEWWERHPTEARWKPWRCSLRGIWWRVLSVIHPNHNRRMYYWAAHATGGHNSLIWHYEPATKIESDEPVLANAYEQMTTHRCKTCFTEWRSRGITDNPRTPFDNPDYEWDADGYIHAVKLWRFA